MFMRIVPGDWRTVETTINLNVVLPIRRRPPTGASLADATSDPGHPPPGPPAREGGGEGFKCGPSPGRYRLNGNSRVEDDAGEPRSVVPGRIPHMPHPTRAFRPESFGLEARMLLSLAPA